VLDPVMVAKSGDALLAPDAVSALRHHLVPLATVLTPNLPEAGVLLDRPTPATVDDMRAAARALHAAGARAVLVKGGHLAGGTAIDILDDGQSQSVLAAPRIPTRNTHGTGCSLSAAIAALLPRHPPAEAVRRAKDYLSGAIAAADRLSVGGGHGPVHHFHGLWAR
jgi:hydroxymethylpyrimidine/phosphomethylpyrimidine kinase